MRHDLQHPYARQARLQRPHRRSPRRLRRQLFFSFGLAILAAMLTSGWVAWLIRSMHTPHPWMRILVFAAAGGVLWLSSGVLAIRLALPLWELSRVVKDFGAGKLESRVHTHRRSPLEVAELGAAFNDMADRIQAQMHEQRELLGSVSHELRTPLARLRVLLGILQESSGENALTAKFEREIVEMDALVGELLAEARIQAGALTKRPLDLDDMVRECSERLGLVLDTIETCQGVSADATLISRAITLLLDNATKHGGQHIGVRAVRTGALVRICVEDDGPGFDAADLPQLFAPFARGRGASLDERRGVGLGLYLVRRIAEAHGGDAFAENREQGGARVGFTLQSG